MNPYGLQPRGAWADIVKTERCDEGVGVRIPWRIVAIVAIVVAVAGIAAVSFLPDGSGAPEVADSRGPDPAAGDTYGRQLPSVVDTPTPPAAVLTPTSGAAASSSSGRTAATGAAPATGSEDALAAYLAATSAVIREHETGLAATRDAAIAALAAGDAGALGALIAPDEGDRSAYLDDLADRYLSFNTLTPGTNVDVFAVNQATVYFAYAIVSWTDGGITSQHTIAVPLRYVNGQWHLTSIDDQTETLTFVQSVQL